MSVNPNLILSFPTLISLTAKDREGDVPRSWIQLAKVGSWTSNRYGKFSITPEDLSMMLNNFNRVTPLPTPGEGRMLPMDYDHLSMDPKKPGDGKAAGWIKRLELRENGTELWGEVEWTKPAAESIENGEYRFVSPSFAKGFVHKDGKKIGTTLLAAAITNHPFLEGMASIVLADDPRILADVAVAEPSKETAMEIGQKVAIAEDPTLTPELTPQQRAQTYIVKAVLGDGDDQVVRLTGIKGDEVGWFRVNQLRAADAPRKEEVSPLPKPQPEKKTPQEPVPQTDIEELAAQFESNMNQKFRSTGNWNTAYALARAEDLRENSGRGAKAYHLRGIGAETLERAPEPADAPVISLSNKSGESISLRANETLPQVVARTAREHTNGDQKAAYHLVAAAFPALVEKWSSGEALG